MGQISFGVFGVLFTIAIGELLYRVLRRSYFERIELDVANGRLAALRDSLAAQVADRTAELRSLALHLDRLQETERTRLARELHDELGQQLTAMRYAVTRLGQRSAASASDTADLCEDLAALLDGTHATVRNVVASLRPHIVAELGLVPAAEWLREHAEGSFGLRCTLCVTPAVAQRVAGVTDDVAFVAFRVLQEAATNTARHADATCIELSLALDGDDLLVGVADDGRGFSDSAPRTGLGLIGLRERLAELGGSLEYTHTRPRGLLVMARIPLLNAMSPLPGDSPPPSFHDAPDLHR